MTERLFEEYPDFGKMLKTKTSKNVFYLRFKLISAAVQPFDIFMYYRNTISEKISLLSDINIFEQFEYLMLHRKGYYLPQSSIKEIYEEFDASGKLAKSSTKTKDKLISFPLIDCSDPKILATHSVKEVLRQIAKVRLELKYMCDELEPKDFSKISSFSHRFRKILITLNQMLDDSLNRMLENSIKKLLKLFRFFTLRFDYCDEDSSMSDALKKETKSKK